MTVFLHYEKTQEKIDFPIFTKVFLFTLVTLCKSSKTFTQLTYQNQRCLTVLLDQPTTNEHINVRRTKRDCDCQDNNILTRPVNL